MLFKNLLPRYGHFFTGKHCLDRTQLVNCDWIKTILVDYVHKILFVVYTVGMCVSEGWGERQRESESVCVEGGGGKEI